MVFPERLYIGAKMTVSSLMVALALYRFCHGGAQPLLAAALCFCWAGDLALALAGEYNNRIQPHRFAAGVVCFAAAQCLFCAVFMQAGALPLWVPAVGAAAGACLTLALLRAGWLRSGWLRFGGLAPLLLLYAALVGAMAVCAAPLLATAGRAMGAAGLLFAASDCLIALRSFSCRQTLFRGSLILPLYYAAVFMLALSV